MKWSAAAVLLASTNSCAEVQHDIVPRGRGGRRDDDPKQKNKFVLSKDDAKASSRERYTRKWKKRKLNRRLMKSKHETYGTDKPESIGVLSNDMEGITIDPQDEIVLSVDVKQDQPAQSQGRRLDVSTPSQVPSAVPSTVPSSAPSTVAFKAFQDRCEETSDGEGYVDCFRGFVRGDYGGQTCADACIVNGVSKCCTGDEACGDLNGKVCKDSSCGRSYTSGREACLDATIPYVVGPSCVDQYACRSARIDSAYKSCTGERSCEFARFGSVDSSCKNTESCRDATIDSAYKSCTRRDACIGATIGNAYKSCTDNFSCDYAEIGSADLSCRDDSSCHGAQLAGIDLINSCNNVRACEDANENGEITELINCCSDERGQCEDKEGLDIVNAGCPNAPSEVPSDSPSISQEPSEVPSNVPSQSSAPSDVPSEVPSVSSAPSTVAFQAFQDRCDATSGGEGYVDCDGGFVNGDSSTSCATACGGQCCTGFRACNGFSGKVCKDGSCSSDSDACRRATIPYVAGPSCTGTISCKDAKIGSAYKSCIERGTCFGAQIGSVHKSCIREFSCFYAEFCKDIFSCYYAELSGVTLINSCRERGACDYADGEGAFDELIDCCNEEFQCAGCAPFDDDCEPVAGLDIVTDGCPAPTSMPTKSSAPSLSAAPSMSNQPSTSEVPSQSSAPSSSSAPSDKPSEVPSEVPSKVPSFKPSTQPSNQPSSHPSTSTEPSSSPTMEPSRSSVPSVEPTDSPSNSAEPSNTPSAVPSESTKPSFNPSGVPSQSLEPSVESSITPSTSVMPSSSPIVSDTKSAKKRPWKAKAKGDKKINQSTHGCEQV